MAELSLTKLDNNANYQTPVKKRPKKHFNSGGIIL